MHAAARPLLRRARRSFGRGRSRFGPAEGGVAILEFALITPLLLLIYFGTVELATAMRYARKLDLLSRTLGDTFSQRNAPTAAEAGDIFHVAPIVMAPFDSSSVRMTVSAVGVVGDEETGPLQVCSSAAAPNAPVRIPGSLASVEDADSVQAKGARFLLVEVTATYVPVAGATIFPNHATGFTLTRKTLWPVRYGRRFASQSPEIILAGGIACPVR